MAQGEVSVKIGADASEYIGAIQSSKQAIADFAKANSISLSEARAAISAWTRDQAAATQAAAKEWASVEKQQKQAMAEMAKAAKEQGATIDAVMGGAFTGAKVAVAAAAAAFVAAAGALYDFTDAAVDAANLMDPKGARDWADATLALGDAWTTFAGEIGKAVRPEIEGVMHDFVDLIHQVDTLAAGEELKEWFDAAIESAKDLGGVLKTVIQAMKDLASDDSDNDWQKHLNPKMRTVGPQATIIGPTPGAGGDQHYDSASDVQAKAAVQMRAFREQMKAFAEQKEQMQASLKLSELRAETDQEAAKEVYDLSHKTYAEKQIQEEATASADAQHLQVLEQALAQAKKQTEEFKAHNTLRSPKEMANLEADAGSNRMLQPSMAAERAREMVEIRAQQQKEQALKQLEQQQNQIEQQVAKAQLTAYKDVAAVMVTASEQAEEKVRAAAEAQMAGAQFTFDMSNKTFADERALLQAKLENAQQVSDLAKGDAARAKAQLDIEAAMRAQQTADKSHSDLRRGQFDSEKVASAQHASNMSGGNFDSELAVKQAQLAADQDLLKIASDQVEANAKILKDQRDIAEFQDKRSRELKQPLQGAASQLAGPLGPAVDKAMQGDLPAAASAALSALITASSSFKMMQESLAPLIQAFADVVGIIGLVENGLLPILIVLQLLGPLLTAVSKGVQDVLNGIMAPFKLLGGLIGSVASAFGGVLAALNPLTMLGTVFQPLVTAIQQALSGAGGGITQGLEQFGKLISFIGQSFTRATQIFNPVAQVFETFIQAISASFGPIIGKLGNAMTEVASIFETALMPVLPVIESLFSQFATMLSGPLGSAMATVFNAGIKFSAAVLNLAGAFLQAVSSAVDGINTILNDVMNATGGKNGVFGGLYDTVKDLIGVTNTLAAGSQAAFDASNALNQVTWNSVSAQIDLAASTNALNTQLTNLPASFNVAQAYNQAIAAGGLLVGATALTQPLQVGQNTSNPGGPMTATSGGTYGGGYLNNANDRGEDSRASVRHGQLGGSDGSGMTVIIEGDLTVSANNPNELAQQLASLSASRGNSRTIAPTNRGVKMNSTLR